MARIKN